MTDVLDAPAPPRVAARMLPERLHHHAWVVVDQERTRAFYEDVLGLPLVQFWIEETDFQGTHILLSHAFYALRDGSALAFFCLATPELHERFKSPKTEVFNHLALKVDKATQDHMLARLEAAGYNNFHIEHGYCRSLYVKDPDGLLVEFTLDSPDIEQICETQRRTAHQALRRWMAGDRRSNNDLRH